MGWGGAGRAFLARFALLGLRGFRCLELCGGAGSVSILVADWTGEGAGRAFSARFALLGL